MIKRFIAICLLTLMFTGLKAQPYGNEWIKFPQKYYKIKVANVGSGTIFRIDINALNTAGIPVNSIDPRTFQIFNRGVEQFIFVAGENDGVFNTNDFIEFYGHYNDGQLELPLYNNTAFLPQPSYSLINDTAIYFLTWNNSGNNKRMKSETDVSFGSYTPSPYFMNEVNAAFYGTYYPGETDVVGGTDSRYTQSEGYFNSQVISLPNPLTGPPTNFEFHSMPTPNVYTSGPNAILQTVVVGASKDISFMNANLPDHHLVIQYKKSTSAAYIPLKDTLFKGYACSKFSFSIAPSLLGSTKTDISYTSIADPGFVSNRTVVSYTYFKYPHTFNMDGKSSLEFYMPDNPAQPKSYLNMSNFVSSGNVYLYDLTNGKRINVIPNGSNYDALLPNGGGEKKCFITSDGYITNVTSLQPVGSTGEFTNYKVLATDSAFIIVTNKKLMSSANDYKNYRSSNIHGGLHNVILADVDELYDQFAYGVVKSPLAIRGFSDFLLDTYPTKPQNLFLIGKSLHIRLCRSAYVPPPGGPNYKTNYNNCLVPSFGNVSSDNLLTAGLNGTILEPAIPTGRLAAKDDNDVSAYLNKIIEYEDKINNPPSEWKKQVLHFGGGHTEDEQSDFKTYLHNYQSSIEGVYYGAKVTSFFKTNSEPIQLNTSTILKKMINNGVSLMTFFGHASATTGFDQSIDDVNTYNPLPGHYPFLLANGCFVGDIHDVQLSNSESYLFAQGKGLIGYLGTDGLGVPYALNTYSQEFYDQLSRKNYNKSVGSTIQRVVNAIQSSATTDPLIASVCMEMNLHGDPSLKLNTYDKPDYEITNDKVFFDLTSDIDSATVYIVRTNIGRQTSDTIFTEMIRTLPNGERQEFRQSSAASRFKDTVSFKFFVDQTTGIGINRLKITLDSYSEVDELNENNNSINNVNMLIRGVGIKPVYPYEFAIIPNDTVTLRATTIDPFADARNYIFQFDTTDSFNSPMFQSTSINSTGGVLNWKPVINFTDSTVYYWRVSPDSLNTSGYHWNESSFQYIKDKKGWEQAHFFQFKNDEYEYVKFNRPQRRFDFSNDIKTVSCHDAIYGSAPDWYLIKWELNKYQKSYWHCNQTFPSFSIVVIDPVTGNNWESPDVPNLAASANNGVYGECHCVDGALQKFDYLVKDSVRQDYLTKFINNVVPVGHYVLAYSMNNVNFPAFNKSLLNAFESLGSSQIRTIPASRPYILWGKKGSPIGSANEMVGSNASSILDFNTTFATNFDKGTISSPKIGPAKSWGAFHWRQHIADGPNVVNSDSVSVKIIGIKPDGSETTVANFRKDQIDILDLSSYVDANVYPSIRLVATMKDAVLHTPPQMERWQVIYEPAPEGAINPLVGFYISNDTVQEGEDVTLRLPFQNISDVPFADSLLITYWSENTDGSSTPLFSKIMKSGLAPNEVLIDTLKLPTSTFTGIAALWTEVNPVGQSKSQLEQYHFNNFSRIPLIIVGDHTNPLIDVTFDGIHILNKDIVSAKPNILIKLKDENQFLALNDTADFQVFVQTPNSLTAKRVYFGPEMSFIPAVLPNNSCQLNYTPIFPIDGTHQLIVQAKDKSNNLSGSDDYKISFEVINKSTITEVMNYPNPFSTSTRFVFYLTGSEIPTYFKIQILTITGKVIREITQDELGPIHIGRNITEYAWNGRDQFGDPLANGVYLYRVVTSIKGTSIDKRETLADQYFKKGFGKMYLMR